MRLSNETLAQIPAGFSTPQYERQALGTGIVHLGIGAFHRCHMAVYTDDVLAGHGGDWRIVGVSMRGDTIQRQLNPQDGLYTVSVKDSSQTKERIVGSIANVLFAPRESGKVIDAIARATTHIVSLTVTEKGYCHDPATNSLNVEHPDIEHDLKHTNTPRSAIGFLVAGLKRRKQINGMPMTILCCDNLPSNGATVARITNQFASLIDPTLASWIHQNVSFPSTMVDRIVPAMEAKDAEEYAKRVGFEDQAVLQTEPFSQWVIEDNFVAPRPAWEKVGATLVDDVEPFEEAKLRMLNGSHSALAYLGYVAGHSYVHEAMGKEDIRYFVNDFMLKEAATSLVLPQGMDITKYSQELQQRYDNSALKHKTYQIAMDGSQKIPQRFLATLRFHLKHKGSIDACCLAIAGWMRYVSGVAEDGSSYVIQDPLAARISNASDLNSASTTDLVKNYLKIQEIFSTDLLLQPLLIEKLSYWLSNLLSQGVMKTLEKYRRESEAQSMT